MTPRAGPRLGRGCFARGEGGVRVVPLTSAGGRPAGWATREWERETAVGPDSVSSRVLAQYQIGIWKILFFFKYFYNLQTDLNSIQI
jgi:hypothetical protein